MNRVRKSIHLAKRAIGAWSDSEPGVPDIRRVEGVLLPGENELWCRMQGRDKRHSIDVLQRFLALRPEASREEQAAALLHDVGKIASRLGWAGRVAATIAGGRTDRMRRYLDHERIGVELLGEVSHPRTLGLLTGESDDEVVRLLRLADDI